MGTNKYLIAIVFGGLFFQACANLSLDLGDLPDEILRAQKEAAKVEYRLPESFKVWSYNLTIKPYFKDEGNKKAFTFDGSVIIDIQPLKDGVKDVVIHAQGLRISGIEMTALAAAGTKITISNTYFDAVHSFLILNLTESLDKNIIYRITFPVYSGDIQDDMTGFYRSHYIQNGEEKWFGTTQLGLTEARKVFPCFDEPRYKASINLTIYRPKEFKNSLSNMPMKSPPVEVDGRMKEEFHTTPRMSTYLLAFIVSEFEAAKQTDNNDAEKFGVWARPDANKQGDYSFENGIKLVKAMDGYTEVPYYKMSPNMKLDHAAIPDFPGGAMENWGLIIYREPLLMYDSSESSSRYMQQVNTIVAHEISHMWFGDYVTCHWWSDTWLNEGFASLFEYMLPDLVQNLNLQMAMQFSIQQVQRALLADTSIHSAPLTNLNVNTPTEISEHFSIISYQKGASVLRMIMFWLKENNFKAAITKYLNNNKFDVVTPDILFTALQEQVADDESVIENKKVKEVMSSWTKISGYPLITVKIDYDSGDMEITQTRFVKEAEVNPQTLYMVPLTFATKSNANFGDLTTTTMLTNKTMNINKGSKGHEWVVFNKMQIGYYRVNYDDHSWQMLESALKNNRTQIHTLNRAQIVDDLFNLARENVLNYHTTFNVTRFLWNETDYAPWTSAMSGLSFLRNQFNHMPEIKDKLDNYTLRLMNNVTSNLGISEKDDDTHLHKLFRINLMNFACKLGHAGCVNESIRLFNNMVDKNEPVKPNLREYVYCTGLRNGDGKHFDKLWEKYKSSNVANEKVVILGALGCTNITSKVQELLQNTITPSSGIRYLEIMIAFNSAVNGNEENVDAVFDFIQKNIADMQKYYKGSFQSAIANLVSSMKGAQLQKFKAFLDASKDQLSESEYNAGITGLANVALDREWASLRKDEIESWLVTFGKSSASIFGASFGLVLTVIITLLWN